MPRKAVNKPPAGDQVPGTEIPDGPRRSTRISSQPGQQDAKAPQPRQSGKNATKKRSLEDEEQADSGDAAESKKAKVVDEDIPALPPIDIGDSLPSLTLKNEKDEDVEVSTLTAEKGVILFLVPKADTPGCTTQACGFRDIHPDFSSLNFDVYCLSSDTPAAQMKWQAKKTLPYPLLSDRKRVLIKALTGSDTKTARSHFIFQKGGVLVDKKLPVKPADSPKLALEFVKGLKSPQEESNVAEDA